MTAGIDKIIIHCCDCGKSFSIMGTLASDLTSPTIKCPHCGRTGDITQGNCRRQR